MFVGDFFFPLMQLTPEEEQRRKLRRERNKVAASKCRMKRKEHVNTLRKVGARYIYSLEKDCSVVRKYFSNNYLANKALLAAGDLLLATSPSVVENKIVTVWQQLFNPPVSQNDFWYWLHVTWWYWQWALKAHVTNLSGLSMVGVQILFTALLFIHRSLSLTVWRLLQSS